MKKAKKTQTSKERRNMLGRELGSMEDLKTHEDFNYTHPNALDHSVMSKDNMTEDENKAAAKNMEEQVTHSFHVSGMSCGGCVAIVKNKLSAAPGVTSVQVDLAKKEALITSSQAINADTLQEALINTGYAISEHGT